MPFGIDSLILGPCEAAFGETGGDNPHPVPVYTVKKTGLTFPLNGIFDEAYHAIDPAMGTAVGTASPMLNVRSSSFPPGVQPVQNDTVVLTSVKFGGPRKYVVKQPVADGHGSIRLELQDGGVP